MNSLKINVLVCLLLGAGACASQDTIFELDPAQSMLMTGKGPGQDGAINPYAGQNSLGIIKNIGKNPFEIRLQKKGKVLQTIPIRPGETKEVKLLAGHELYFDTEQKAKARLNFKKID